jgi:RHS repeat-associated protein
VGQRTADRDQAAFLTQFGYDVSGQLTNVIKPQVPDPENGNNPTTPSWSYAYDVYGRLRVTTDAKGRSTTNTYNEFGQPVARLLPMGGPGETNVYNPKGQLWKHYDFKGQKMEFRYDQYGRVTNKFYFEASDQTHPSNSVQYIYNQLGQLTNITERMGTNAGNGYAMLGNGRGKWMARTSRLEELRAVVLASLGTVPPGGWSGMTALALCGLAWSLVPREKRRQFVWCVVALWRAHLRTLSLSDGKSDGVRGFLAALQLRQPASIPRRLRLPSLSWRCVTVVTLICLIGSDPYFESLWTAQAACGDVPSNTSTETVRVTTFTYELEGRLAQVNSPEGYINYEYSLATGRLTKTCTEKSEIGYQYDSLGRLWNVQVLKRNGTNVTEQPTVYSYTPVGSRETVTLPNGIITTYQYDSLNRLTNLVNSTTNNSLRSQFSYGVDGTGRRTNAMEIVKTEDTGNVYQTNILTWAYDQMYRLTNEVCLSTVSGANYSNAYSYDKAGNRKKKIRYSSVMETNVSYFNDNDQLMREEITPSSGTAKTNYYAYDANGSVIARTNVPASGSSTIALYRYDLKNKMSNVETYNGSSWTTNRFQYNDQGIRVRTIQGSTTINYLVDANNHTGYAQVLEERTGSTLSKSYSIGNDVLSQATGSTASWLLYDGHGSTRQVASTSGTVTSRYNYNSYGETLDTSTSSAETSLLYCGEQFDPMLGMYNLRSRFYHPETGRFNGMDSFLGNNEDPQSLHKYNYANCDPANWFDPSGQLSITQTIATVGILAISAGIYLGYRTKDPKNIVKGVLAGAAFTLGFGFARTTGTFKSAIQEGIWAAVIAVGIDLLCKLGLNEAISEPEITFDGFEALSWSFLNGSLAEHWGEGNSVSGNLVTTLLQVSESTAEFFILNIAESDHEKLRQARSELVSKIVFLVGALAVAGVVDTALKAIGGALPSSLKAKLDGRAVKLGPLLWGSFTTLAPKASEFVVGTIEKLTDNEKVKNAIKTLN